MGETRSTDRLTHYRYVSGDNRIKGKIIFRLHEKLKRRFRLSKYFDPKGSRTSEDFEQIARIGVRNALESYNPEKGPLDFWIIDQVKCALAREVKKILRELNPQVSFEDQFRDDDHEISDFLVSQVDKNKHYAMINSDEGDVQYQEFVERVKYVLKKQPRLYKLFVMKLCYPNYNNRKLAGLTNLSFSALSQEMQKIKMAIKLVAQDHSETYEEHGL